MLCLNKAGGVSNSVDHNETPRSAASQLGLTCLRRPVCPNTHAQIVRQKGTNMTKSSVITNLLSITMAGLIIDYFSSSD